MNSIVKYPSPNGEPFSVGSVIIFDFGTYPHIGIIDELYQVDEHILVSIRQPSGRIRKRTLDYDVENGFIRLLSKDDADYIHRWYQFSSENK